MPSPLCSISLLLPVVFELLASLLLFLDYNFMFMSHFFACFLDAVPYPSPLLHSWADAGGERFPSLHSPLHRCPCKLPGHTFRVGWSCPQSAAGASFWRILNFFFLLQHFKFPAIKSPINFFTGVGGSKITGNTMPVSIFVID